MRTTNATAPDAEARWHSFSDGFSLAFLWTGHAARAATSETPSDLPRGFRVGFHRLMLW